MGTCVTKQPKQHNSAISPPKTRSNTKCENRADEDIQENAQKKRSSQTYNQKQDQDIPSAILEADQQWEPPQIKYHMQQGPDKSQSTNGQTQNEGFGKDFKKYTSQDYKNLHLDNDVKQIHEGEINKRFHYFDNDHIVEIYGFNIFQKT